MSIEIMNRVWSQSQQQGTKLVLLLALADMANSNGYCWPSLDTLQQRARLSHRQNVIKAIAEMETMGEVWVEHSRGRNHSNTYIVTVGMGAEDLAKTLITYFDYSPTDAMQKANDFVKRSPQTTLSKCSPEAENVVEELHLNQENVVVGLENVVVGLIKRSPQTTRSVIEPIDNHNTSATQTPLLALAPETAPVQPVGQEKALTPQQEYFSALCWVVGWDHKTITKAQSGQVAQTVGILQDAGYSKDDLRLFWSNVWAKDWRWEKHKQRPTLSDVRSEIGKLRIVIPPEPKTVPSYKRMKALN